MPRYDGTVPTTIEHVDKLVDGRLTALLSKWRDESVSYDRIADQLRVQYSVDVNGETIRRWCYQLGVK